MSDKKRSKKVAPIIITAVVLIISAAYITGFVALAVTKTAPLFVCAIAILVYAIGVIGISLSLKERIKEINGGEEDEARKY